MPVVRRKHQWQRPGTAEIANVGQRWGNGLNLFVGEILTVDKSAENYAGVQGVRREVAVFVACLQRTPVVCTDRAKFSLARHRRRATVLLCAVNPIRKLLVGDDVIKLPVGLVVPGTPGSAAIQR